MNVYTEEGCSHDQHNEILILGEGNFSFALEFSSTDFNKLYATSFDSKETVFKNKFARVNVESLSSKKNVQVHHGVDATNLSHTFKGKIFSKIIFNFPHVGGKSNIKKCRLLLKNFFASACEHVCNDGAILIALCKGQGGTPIDEKRNAYGNTWQVVSQAAFSGMYLARIEIFHFDQLNHYKQAGYRGEIGCGFLTKGGYIHVFKKGMNYKSIPRLIDNEKSNKHPRHSSFMAKDLSPTELKYIQRRLKSSSDIFTVLLDLLKASTQLIESNTLSTKDLQKYLSSILCIEEEVYMDTSDIPVSEFLHAFGDCQFGINYVDFGMAIHPESYFLSQHFVYLIQSGNVEEFDLKLDKLTERLFSEFDYEIRKCSCAIEPYRCSCASHNTLCKDFKCKLDLGSYDPSIVPYFLADVPKSFWSNFGPECTISSLGDGEEVIYTNVDWQEYTLDEAEKKYFSNSKQNKLNYKQKKVFIEDTCVATVRIYENAETIDSVIILHLDHILVACYKVPDIRLLYTGDECFQNDLKGELQNDLAVGHICNHDRKYTNMIKYPLVHRHDLCFWLDDRVTEYQLLSMARSITGDNLHSVRLLKVLKHTETNLFSYCYRLIYSSYDGPLSSKDCVALQNEFRLCLMEAGFSLR